MVTALKTSALIAPKAPNLPIGPDVYDQRFQDQFSNVLRLYFSQIDNFCQPFSNSTGGSYLRFPHIAAQDSTTQYATGSNVPTAVQWNTLDSGLGFTLNLDGSATAQYPGIYKIDYSLQLANSDNVTQDAHVWLTINNAPLAGSASNFTLPARKSAGVFSHVVAYSSVTYSMNSGDSVKLWWATSLAATSGGATGIFIENTPAQTLPYVRPSNPSAIGVITFVSALPA